MDNKYQWKKIPSLYKMKEPLLAIFLKLKNLEFQFLEFF
jgi:hypothetical protein